MASTHSIPVKFGHFTPGQDATHPLRGGTFELTIPFDAVDRLLSDPGPELIDSCIRDYTETGDIARAAYGAGRCELLLNLGISLDDVEMARAIAEEQATRDELVELLEACRKLSKPEQDRVRDLLRKHLAANL
jgi:hypothetical protein